MNKNYPIAPCISSSKNVPICWPEDQLGTALQVLKSSHAAVFIYDHQFKFLGLISPYFCLFLHRFPYESKVRHCLFIPPKINSLIPLYRVTEFMIATKIYTLPVFNNQDQVVGVVTADNVLKFLVEDSNLLKQVAEKIEVSQPVTASINSKVKEVYAKMRDNNISRVILIDNEGKLAGIVSRRDIQDDFTAKTVRQRFTTKKHPPIHSSFDEEKTKRRDSPIAEFAKVRVLSAKDSFDLKKILTLMINSKIHSIVLVNSDNIPTGFISRRDVIKAISSLKPEDQIPITYKYPTGSLDMLYFLDVFDLIDKFTRKFNKKVSVQKVAINFVQTKDTSGITRVYNTTLHVILKSGKLLIAKSQRRKLKIGVREAIEKIEAQEDKSDRQKHYK